MEKNLEEIIEKEFPWMNVYLEVHQGWLSLGGDLGYQCERHWCVDNSLFKEYELKIIKKENKSKP